MLMHWLQDVAGEGQSIVVGRSDCVCRESVTCKVLFVEKGEAGEGGEGERDGRGYCVCALLLESGTLFL